MHLVLLGDSIFDNAAYVRGGPDVVAQLRAELPAPWRATLCALDGATTADVPRQAGQIPADATHLVLSVGGNDALDHTDILGRPARSVAEVLGLLAALAEAFAPRYAAALDALLAPGLPLTVCTVYHGSFPDAAMGRLAATALTHFNDVILRAAFARGLPVIDLRTVCTTAGDYANPIEPSVQGGGRIARAIRRAVVDDAPARGSRVASGF